MGLLDNLKAAADRVMAGAQTPESDPAGEHPSRPYGQVVAEGSGSDEVEPEQGRAEVSATEAARAELVADLTRLVLDTQPRVTVQPSKRLSSGTIRISSAPIQIVGFQPDRMRITILNLGRTGEQGWVAFPCVVAESRQAAASGQGFYLWEAASHDQGAERLVLETQAEIWVCLRDLPGDTILAATDYQYANYLIEYGD